MQREFRQGRSQEKFRRRSFSRSFRQDWPRKRRRCVRKQSADQQEMQWQKSWRTRNQVKLFFSWQCDCDEKGRGEREHEDDQIHKSAKKEFENADEPPLAVNAPDR